MTNEKEQLHVTSLDFRFHAAYKGWKTDGSDSNVAHWTASARFSGGDQVKDLGLELDATMSSEIMRLLAPILAAKASVAAQSLADQSKAISNDLSKQLMEQTP